MTNRLPYFKTMAPDALRAAYREWRTLAHRGGQMAAQTTTRGARRRKVASSWGNANRAVEIIERIADSRGISLR